MNRTNIQWTDFSVGPIRYRNADGLDVWACSKVSAGCTNCYAETLALSPRMVSKGRALGAKFNDAEMAKLTPYMDEEVLRKMLTFKPRGLFRTGGRPMVFVGDMTDVFGPWVQDEWLDRLFAVFALRPDVTWQVLTKRPERMRAYLSEHAAGGRHVWTAAQGITMPGGRTKPSPPWPLPNVWLGTSVEDQQAADSRIPELLATPAAVRFLSCEPLLGPVDLRAWLEAEQQLYACQKCGEEYAEGEKTYNGRSPCCTREGDLMGGTEPANDLHWVIGGGESGAGARPCDLAWLRSLRDQCAAAGVAYFNKQLGAKPGEFYHGRSCNGAEWHGFEDLKLRHGHGGSPEEWPADLRRREWPVTS